MIRSIGILFFVSHCYLFASSFDSIANRIEFNASKFKYILESISNNYADSIDIDKLCEMTFYQMLNSLDQHSIYLSKELLYNKNIDDDGSVLGTGLQIKSINDTIWVYSVIDNSPAYKSGIRPYDRIISINNTPANEIKPELIDNLLKNDSEPTIMFEINSLKNKKTRTVNLKKEFLPVSSLNSSFILPNSNIAYINFRKFSRISHDELDSVMIKLQKQGMKRLIIDLRDNPGGFLEQVGEIINEFLAGYDTITYTVSRNPQFRYSIVANDKGKYKKLPLIILVNENTASACELFAAAMQDLDRALVVGRKTFGKSSAQMLWKMNDSTGFQMTVAHYLTPLGRKLSKPRENDNVIDDAMKLSLSDEAIAQLNNMINIYGTESKIPICYSKTGRRILCGSSVFPDYFVENKNNTLLTDVLIQKNIIGEYIYKYINSNFHILENKYGSSIDKFSNEFIIDEILLSELKSYSYSKNIWNEEMFQNDKSKIQSLIKAEIARALFGDFAYYRILIKNDIFVERAVKLMLESETLLRNQ